MITENLATVFSSIVAVGTKVAISFGEYKIKDKLDGIFKRTVVNSAIKLVLFTIALLMATFCPFGKSISWCIASVIFILAFIWMIYRWVRNCIKIYPEAKILLPKLIETKSLRRGIAEYVRQKYPLLKKAGTIKQAIALFSTSVKNIPSLETVIHYYIKFFEKYIITFSTVFSIYCLLFCLVAKPLLLKYCAQTTVNEMYFYLMSISQN